MNDAVREIYIVLLSRLANTRSAHQNKPGAVMVLSWVANWRQRGTTYVRARDNQLQLIRTKIILTPQPVPITIIGRNVKNI